MQGTHQSYHHHYRRRLRLRLHHNLNSILRSRFISRTLFFVFIVFSAIPLSIIFSGSLSSSSCGKSGDSDMRLSSSVAKMAEPSVSCTTFNILAPIYKRLDQQNQSIRESDFRACWFARNQRILDWLLHERSSVICLQEFWVGNEELVRMYQESLGNAGYSTFQLARTNNRGDVTVCPWSGHKDPPKVNFNTIGLLTAIHKDYLKVVNYRELLFNDFGDRVAQLLHVQSVVPFPPNGKENVQQEILIMNTHLLFPHDSSLSIVRLHQVYKILEYLEAYQKENKLSHMPIILCGDWNGSKRGHVYKFLRSQGFVSSYDIAHQYTDSDADAHKWVSHRNHRGNICGVDFIWLRNPSKSRKPLKTSWEEAIFGIIKYQLQKASIAKDNVFAFLRADNHSDCVTYSNFFQALQQVNLTGLPYGLSFEDTKGLWLRADLDGNGVLDYEEFKRIWNSTLVEQTEYCDDSTVETRKTTEDREEAIGFKVKNAYLFPTEAEKGMWPENYSLSDHARLTVEFSPVRMLCS